MMDPVGLAALAGAAVFLMVAGASFAMSRKESVADRLNRYGTRQGGAESTVAGRAGGESSVITAGLGRAIAGRDFAAQTARELARADLKLTVSEYLLISGMVVVGGFVLGSYLGRSIILGAVIGVAGFYLPGLYVRLRQRARLNAFNARLGDTITMLANSLRSGYSLPQGMDMIAREQPPPMSDEFGRVVREIGLGLSAEEALANLVRRVPSEDLDLMVTAINVQHEVGGNLAQILDSIGVTIRERVRIKGEIRSLTAQVTVSSYVVGFMPIAMVLILLILSPDYIMRLFSGICGWSMAILGAIFLVIGFLVMRKIADIEV